MSGVQRRTPGAAGAATTASTTAPVNNGQSAPSEAPVVGAGAAGLMQRHSGAVPSSLTGENARRFHEAFAKIAANNNGGKYAVLVLDAQQHGVPMSAVVIATLEKGPGRDLASGYALLVESSGPKLNNLTHNTYAGQIEIQAVPGDILELSDGVINKIRGLVASHFQVNESLFAGGQTIFTEVLPEDEVTCYRLFCGATEAIRRTIDAHLGNVIPRFNVSQDFVPGDQVKAILDYGPVGVETRNKMPTRSDVAIHTRAIPAGAGAVPFSDQTVEICTTDIIVGLEYRRPPQAVMGQPTDNRCFQPRCIISNVDQRLGSVTMEMLMFAIHTATLLTQQMAWAYCFRNRQTRGINLRDIGGIGLEVPALTGSTDGIGRKIDTQSNSWTNKELFELINATIVPDPIFSIDVPEWDDDSWIKRVLVLAAQGDPRANRMIVDACNALTNGRFGAGWNGGRIVLDDGNRVHLGYYVDGATNTKRDIRDIDYLAVLNLVANNGGQADMRTVEDYLNTYYDVNTPAEKRLKTRTELLNLLVGNTMRVYGYARRLNFDPNFLRHLAVTVQADGFNIIPGNMQNDLVLSGRRTNDSLAALGVNAGAFQGGFAMGGMQGGGSFGHIGNRWGGFM